MKNLIFLLMLTISTNLKAQSIDLVVIRRDEISSSQQIQIFEQAVSRLKEVGIITRITSIREVSDTVNKNALSQSWSRLFDWAKAIYRNPAKITFFLLPPLDGAYMAGAGGATCVTTRNKTRRFGYSVVRLRNNVGLDRVQASIDTAFHELLHLFGANHIDNTPNIMRSYWDGNNRVLPLTKRQVNYCKQNRSPVGRFRN